MHLVSVFMHNNEGAYLTPPLNVVVVVFLQTILMATLAIDGKQWPLQLKIPKSKNTYEGPESWSRVWPPHRRPCRGLCSPAVGIVSSYLFRWRFVTCVLGITKDMYLTVYLEVSSEGKTSEDGSLDINTYTCRIFHLTEQNILERQ